MSFLCRGDLAARSRVLGVALLLAVAWPAAAAWAITVPSGFELDFEVTQGGSTWTGTHISLANELGSSVNGDETTLELSGPRNVLSNDSTITSWSSTFDPDPFVTNNFVVVNNSGSSQVYTVTVTSPVTPSLNLSQILQSNVILSINDDDNANGASVSSFGGAPVYEAFVNGSSELSFLDDPFSNGCASPFDCGTNGTSSDGVVSQAFGPVLGNSLGITITFELSAGDSASVQSRFEVVPEPGLAALALGGLAAAGLVAGRRRR